MRTCRAQVKEILGPRGVALACDRSYPWGVYMFAKGLVPTECLIDGKKPGVTLETLRPLIPILKQHGAGRSRRTH